MQLESLQMLLLKLYNSSLGPSPLGFIPFHLAINELVTPSQLIYVLQESLQAPHIAGVVIDGLQLVSGRQTFVSLNQFWLGQAPIFS